MTGQPEHTGIDTAQPVDGLLAAARFGIPEVPEFHVRRPRLEDLLVHAGAVPLVLVSAPAGTGKTSLVAEWLRHSGPGGGVVGWITFEDDDKAFWGFVIDCLGRLGLDLPVRSADVSTDTPLGARRLTALASAIVAAPEPISLVIDGYELVSQEIAREVDLLLRHTFGRLRVVLVGRVDPVLPLYRYRLADRLREIRVAELAFTDDEAAHLLSGLGVSLDPESVRELNQRTKGWAAGLRFAGRILAGRDDPGESVATVVAQAGDINEYLVGEVLDTQTPEVRRFLLRTCVPDMLWPELAEELAGPVAGHALGELTKANAFIEPVPDQPGAYRYYPFFRDLLRAQLAYEEPQTLVDLHRTVARCYLRQGLVERSLAHLAAIGEWDGIAAHVVDAHLVGRLLLEPANGPLRSVAVQLPNDVEQPAACVVRGAAALADDDSAAAAVELSRARRAPAQDATDGADHDALAASISVLDAVRAGLAEDAGSALQAAQEAERATSPRQGSPPGASGSALAGLAALACGVARLRRGELAEARAALAAALDCDAAVALGSFRAECLGYLALVDTMDGHLRRARRTATESITAAADAGEDGPPAAYVALARVALEQYDLEESRQHIDVAMTSRALQVDPVSRVLAQGVLAGLDRAVGHLQQALARLDASVSRAIRTDPWLSRCLRVEAAQLNIANGDAELALSTLESLTQVDDAEVAVLRAAAYAEQGLDTAVRDSLVGVRAGDAPLRARVAELLLEGACESRLRSSARSRDLLNRSLRLAAPERMRRPFREASPAVQRVLSADRRLLPDSRWLDQPGRPEQGNHQGRAGATAQTSPGQDSDVVEPLTARELEVLKHLEELLTTEEIAEKMFVSVNTVRTHVRSILRKLGVSRRNAAVRKARRLGLAQD